MSSVLTWLGRWLCGLKGHPEAMLLHEPHRLALRCHDCGWTSSGWEIGKTAVRRVIWLGLAQDTQQQRRVA